MTSTRRDGRSDLLLLGLALAGGAMDGLSFLGLGQVFTANMTGNTVLLATALARGVPARVFHSAAALGGFCCGTAVAVSLPVNDDEHWPASARWALSLEFAALLALLVAWLAAGVPAARYGLIPTAGFAMAAQSAAVNRSEVKGVNTTYMTSTLLNAVAFPLKRIRSRDHTPKAPELPGLAWIVYGAGALAGAFAVRLWHGAAVSLPLGVVCVVTAVAWTQMRRRRRG